MKKKNWMVGVSRINRVDKKYYIISGTIILTLLVFVFIDESKGNYYKKPVADTYTLLANSNINISASELKASGQETLKINVVFEGEESEQNNYISVRTENLLSQKFIEQLEQHSGNIVIVSEDLGIAANVWFILTRKGFDNIKILGIEENETLGYTFEPEIETPDTH